MTSSALPAEAGVAIFAKAPIAGEVKTRLAATLGAGPAAELHAALTTHALRVATGAAAEVELWCAPDDRHPFFAECAARFGVRLRVQRGRDLGERMRTAFEAAFARGRGLVAIGSDCPALTPEHVREAACALRTHDAVFIPAEDGGYVLAALARVLPPIFEDIAWGGDTVMRDTRARLAAAGASWRELPMLWDVDRAEDYARLRRSRLLDEAPC